MTVVRVGARYLHIMDAKVPLLEHDTPYVHLSADTSEGLLMVRWKNYVPSGTYRATLDIAVQWTRDHHLHSFLTDQRRRGPILREDELWIVNDWVPRMVAAGLLRAGIVQSPDFFNYTAVERVMKTVLPTMPHPIMNFQTMEDALEWMTNGKEALV